METPLIQVPYKLKVKQQWKCVIVLPCLNEARNLQSLVSTINSAVGHSIPYRIVAVNDGSTDHTAEILRRLSEKYPTEVLEHKRNGGLASALRTGLNAAIKQAADNDFVITMDADNTHDPCLIPDMIEMCKKGADLVISSRYVTNGNQIGVPKYRVVLSGGINFLIRLRTKSKIRDYTSGYRCYKASTIRKLLSAYRDRFIESEGFEVALELLVKSINLSLRTAELPMILDYRMKKGKSNIKLVRTMLRYAQVLIGLSKWDVPHLNANKSAVD